MPAPGSASPIESRPGADLVLPRRGVAVAALSVTIVAGLSLYFGCRYQDDFRVYLAGAHNLADGALYRSWTRGDLFTYPPFAAIVFVPLAKIPSPIAAQIVWALLNDAALTALIACSIRAVRPCLPARSRWLWTSSLATPAFALDPVLMSIRHGQVNVVLATLVLWDLAGSRRIGAATVPRGAGTGVAAAIKLTPLIFLPYLVLTRRYRAAGNCAAAFALCEGIAFALAPRSSAAYWTRYVFDYRRVGGHLRLDGLLATTNQSLMGALARFTHATVPAGALWAMTVLVGAAGLLLAALVHARGSAFLGIVVCAATGLIVSPVTWTHHMVWIVPAIAWLAAAPERPRWGLATATVTAVLFWAAPIWWVPSGTNGNLRPLHENGWQLVAGNSFFLWTVLFLAAIAALAPPGCRQSRMREKLTAAAVTSISRWTPYLEREISGLRRLVRPGSVCIDVGSAAGLYTAVLSRLAGPAGHVHSIEPLPFAHLLWARILNTRQTANVRRHAVALGTEPGTDIMRVPVGRYGLVTGRSFLACGAGGPDPNAEFTGQVAVTVSVDTLDALCAREAISRIDFIKIDVEGAELQVLEGGKRVIETYRPVMLVEIEARHAARYRRSPDDIAGWLLGRGYTMHIWRHGWRPAGHIHAGTRNYLFRPPAPEPGGPRPVPDQRKLLTA